MSFVKTGTDDAVADRGDGALPSDTPSSPLRVLHTIPGRNWGGTEHRVLDQLGWLVAHGHAAWLAAPPDGEAFQRAVAQGLPAFPVPFDRPWRPAMVTGLRRLVRDLRIDVIDTHVSRDAKAAMGCLDLCAVVRSRHVGHPLETGLSRRWQWRRGADHVVAAADAIRTHLIARGLADPERSSRVGCWAGDRFFDHPDPDGARARLRDELALPPAAMVVLCVAMLRPDKGQDHLLRALARLGGGGAPVVALLAGAATAETGAYADGLHDLADTLGVTEQVRFLGYRNDVHDLMRAADLVVIPSLVEGRPQAAAQAFASGRPVVATDVGGVPEIVTEGVTGWLVPAADPAALARAIRRTLADPFARAAVGRNAREAAERSMRLDACMARTLSVYRAAMDRARSREFPRFRGVK